LDLFAGSGSLGLESLSRQAKLVCFVDQSWQAVKLVRENIALLGLEPDSYSVVQAEAESFLKKYSGPIWDIVFLDPPYRVAESKMKKIFDILAQGKMIDKNSFLIYEYFFKKNIYHEIKKLNIIKEYLYGDKKVTYLTI
jgi:16S rRNA (guanine966-N2)-methyltransferase